MRFFAVLIPACALIAQSQTPPDARSLLIRSGGAVLTADTVRLQGTETSDIVAPASRRKLENSFSIALASGGRMRLQRKSGDSTVLQIADGSSLWTYRSADNTYSQSPAPRGQSDGLSKLRYGRDPANFTGARVEREEGLEFGGKSVSCYVVSAKYSGVPANPMAREIEPGLMEPATGTVWIAKSNDLILRETWEFSTDSASSLALGKSRVTTDYTVVEWGMPLAGDLFVFHPPEGSQLVIETPRTEASARPKFKPPPTTVPVRKVDAKYTPEARAAGLQGTVSLYVEVDRGGKPSEVQVMEGLGLGLDEEAVKAVKHWEFEPKLGSADEIQDALEIDVPFRLDPPGPWLVESESYRVTVPDRRRNEGVVRPVPVRYVAPDASACLEAGDTVVRLTIGKGGEPQLVRAGRGAGSAIADAAVNAVRSWKFQAAKADGKTTEAQGEVEFDCRPAGAPAKSENAPAPSYRVGGAVSPPILVSKTEPEYSEAARQAKVQGTSMLYVQIPPDGKATNIHVFHRIGMGLDQKAIEAVKHWRFTPGARDGQPVTVEATIEVNFRLK
jgi:TonB family protein